MSVGAIQDQSSRFSTGATNHYTVIPRAISSSFGLHLVDFDAYPANNHPPVISAFTPAPGTISGTASIAFTVTDIDANLDVPSICIYVKLSAEAQGELVYGNGGFAPGFSTSTIGAITNGQSFSLKRDAGWVGAFVLYVAADDLLGLNAIANGSYTGPGGMTTADTTAPAITYTTAAGTITSTTPLVMSVTDMGSGIDDLTIYAKRADQAFGELVYGGGAIGPGYSTSTVTSITGGLGFSILRDAGWAGASITLNTYAKDVAGNVASLASGVYVGPTSAGETNPPVVTATTPTSGSTIASGDTLTFTVTDVTPPISTIVDVKGSPNTTPELAYADGAFTPEYSGSSVTTISGGLQFALVRNDGFWGLTLTVGVYARDGLGNKGFTALTYTAPASYTGSGATGPTGGGNDGGTVGSGPPAGSTPVGTGGGTTIVITTTDTTPPYFTNVLPSPGTAIDHSTAITMDCIDETGLRLILVSVNFATLQAPEVAYDGNAFTAPYSGGSTVNSIAGGKHFSFNRSGGWPDAPTFDCYAIDTSGNENNG